MPPPDFLPKLRALCDGARIVLIVDEIYTGFGRTGRWFAVEHSGVVPDLLVVGKALTGSIALSAAIGPAHIMAAWPASEGEALHTSTFLGNPVACAAALAQLAVIERDGLLARAVGIGARIAERADSWRQRSPLVRAVVGAGILQGVRLMRPVAASIAEQALARGVIVLPEGPDNDVLAITPPAVITETQLDAALDIIEQIVSAF